MGRLIQCASSLVIVGLGACQADDQRTLGAAEEVNEIADRYYAWALARQPEQAYFSAVELERHDGLYDNSPEAKRQAEAEENLFFDQISTIDEASLIGTPEWISKSLLEQQLRSDIALRVCRAELWNVNQMSGWPLTYSRVAQLQPVGSAELRQQAVARWEQFAAFVDQEIENLEAGSASGYSAPRAVVERVIAQVDGLLALPTAESPYYSPAARAGDDAFAATFGELVDQQINPALRRYREYLEDSYLPNAREELTVTANPNGADCYEASLRAYTTVDRSGKEVYELGQKTVAANRANVIELGKSAYGLDEFTAILRAAKSDPADKFSSKDELLAFSKAIVKSAEKEMPDWVMRMPGQPAKVVPFPENEEGTGRSAHYNPGNDERPAEYRIPLHEPDKQSRGNAEAVAFHEVWPGHHLQVATFQAIEGLHPVTQIIWFSGPGEGWARYSEGLAEEMGLYTTRSGPILRQAWPARGMVVDPGIHLFGWSREQAREYMAESGRFPETRLDDMVDRIAILPGQLTAYDSGGLEILALRRQAEEALGDGFDIREFHDRVLENGTIPLGYLRRHVEAWIESK